MKLLTLTGPSCSGKTTLLNELVAKHGYQGLVSHTTRAPRNGEVEGVDYFYTQEQKFLEMRHNNEFIETVKFNGFHYGISAAQIKAVYDGGKLPVLIVEPNGLHQISAYCARFGIDLTAVYIGGDAVNLTARYLNRASSIDFSDKTQCEIHAKRLLSINNEASTWHSAFRYDAALSSSNPESLLEDVKFVNDCFTGKFNGKS